MLLSSTFGPSKRTRTKSHALNTPLIIIKWVGLVHQNNDMDIRRPCEPTCWSKWERIPFWCRSSWKSLSPEWVKTILILTVCHLLDRPTVFLCFHSINYKALTAVKQNIVGSRRIPDIQGCGIDDAYRDEYH
jgi:hypothetical protein